MNTPADQAERERFVSELDRNFSVIASAGSGKTRAITDRIVQIAKTANARDVLPQLVVVAFTNRAADEMQQRARAEVLQAAVAVETLAAFNRAFFGTIHAFCVRLLETYGHYLGLPPTFEVITDDDEIWNEFLQQQITIGRSLSEENRRALLRHINGRSLMELGRRADIPCVQAPEGKCPDADFGEIHRYVAKGATVQTVPPYQKELKRVEQIWRETEDFVRWPICGSKAQDFVRIKREAFVQLRKWIDQAALCVAAEVQRDYRQFRIDRGFLTYDDQIALALELTKHPQIGGAIREKSFRVILDEAQDTDPRQFALLLEITRPPEATGDWLETQQSGPGPGLFSMVGDFQQSIYRDRADLSRYREIHNALIETGAAEALKFSVTFRLDRAQLNFINETFREILNDKDDQVAFVELNPRPEVLPGQVVRLDFKPANLRPDPRGRVSDARKAAEEAKQLGKWLVENGLVKLRANNWSDVAVLCPRKEWLQTLRRGLRAGGLNVQIQSEKELKGDSPAYAWLTALLIIMAQPRCSYEIVGILRELFGVSDHDLAVFAEGDADRFQIEALTRGPEVISQKLSLLTQTRLSILPLPLFDAVSEIVRATDLRQRLNSLPAEDFEDLDSELDSLLALAGSSEAEGVTLTDFAELLRTHFSDPREIRPSRADAIQLITSQKAKGSEWQAVIVPFLTRDVRMASPRYPRLIKNRDTSEMIVVLDLSDVTSDIEEMVERENRQEMERLLYVALTRAKHTLVLAFDHELFAKKGGEIHSHSQTKWLQAAKGQPNDISFAHIGAEPASCAITAEYQRARSVLGSEQPASGLAANKIDHPAAIRTATAFVRKLNPSALAHDETTAAEEEKFTSAESGLPRVVGPALHYGLWWHELVAQLDWGGAAQSEGLAATALRRRPGEDWEQIFERHRQVSPDPARSAREWKLLLDHISSPQNFRKGNTGALVHAEMPFLWRIDQDRCLEGVVDLALINSTERKLFLLDWKTDRVPPDSPDTLRSRYLPQLAAYWKAIGEITKFEIAAAIYSTAAGTLIRCANDDLEKEWRRLEKLPPDDFDATVVTPTAPQPPAGPGSQLELF